MADIISFAKPDCFEGHKGSVTDITSFRNDPSSIATTSEDKTIRIWDLRIGKTRQCIAGFGNKPVDLIKYAPYDSHKLFGMTESSILAFDLRREGLILSEAHSVVHSVAPTESSEDACDLSCFAVHPKENLQHLIAVGDDNGTVTIVDSRSGEVTKTLTRVHSNVIGAVAFQPNSPNYLCSGGFDSLFCCWDFTRARPSGDILDFSKDQQQEQQMANPPFVHDLLYKNGGKMVIAAVGDGSLRLLHYVAKKGFVCVSNKRDAHGGITTGLSDFCAPPGIAASGEHCVMSAGIDCYVRGWKITSGGDSTLDTTGNNKDIPSRQPVPSTTTTTISSSSSSSSSSSNNKKKSKKLTQKQVGLKGQTTADAAFNLSPTSSSRENYSFEPLFTINHHHKINAIGYVKEASASSGVEGREGASMIMVADVTSVWNLYKLQC